MFKKLFPALIFLITGLLFVGFGIYVIFFHTNGFLPTTATIVEIKKVSEPGNETRQYITRVKYTVPEVEGYEFTSNMDYYNSTYKVGKKILIYYDPAVPLHIKGNRKKLGIFFIIAGLLSVLVSPVVYKRSASDSPNPEDPY